MDFLPILRSLCDDIWDTKIKLVRHASSDWDLNLILRSGFFHEYDARQGKPRFHDTDYFLSFLGERGSRSRFLGCLRVDGVTEDVPPHPKGYPYPEMGLGKYRYDLHRVSAFEELENRLVIDWGQGTRSWVQNLKPKEVIEILPAGHVRDFPGYADVVLEFDELQQIVDHPDANRLWHRMLGGVAGIYLIVDTVNGDQYVGSAHGDRGIIGRWQAYVRTRHGGNKLLKARLAKHPRRHRRFRFSILRTLPKSLTSKEVIAVESLYKKKLGTRAFGLNAN